jgi:hypothetical protein
MGWWPGWSSIEGASRWQDVFWWLGIALIVLVIGSEVLARMYADRKDILVSLAERSSVEQVRRDQQEAELRYRAEADQLHRQLEQQQHQPTPPREVAFRALDADQKQALVAALAPYHGQKVRITAVVGDPDGLHYAEQFAQLFNQAGWALTNPQGHIDQASYTKNPEGLEPTINQAEAAAGHVPASFLTLVKTLAGLKLASTRGYTNPGIPPDVIEFRVGLRPADQG